MTASKYKVELTEDEREHLNSLVRGESRPPRSPTAENRPGSVGQADSRRTGGQSNHGGTSAQAIL